MNQKLTFIPLLLVSCTLLAQPVTRSQKGISGPVKTFREFRKVDYAFDYTCYDFNEQGELMHKSSYHAALGKHTDTTYDARGEVLRTEAYIEEGFPDENQTDDHFTYKYDSAGNILESKYVFEESVYIERFIYDAQNRVLEQTTFSDKSTPDTKTTFEYNAAGDKTLMRFESDAVNEKRTYTYDEKRRNTGEYFYSIRQGQEHMQYSLITVYQQDGSKNVTCTEISGGWRQMVVDFDSKGNLTRYRYFNKDKECTQDLHFVYIPGSTDLIQVISPQRTYSYSQVVDNHGNWTRKCSVTPDFPDLSFFPDVDAMLEEMVVISPIRSFIYYGESPIHFLWQGQVASRTIQLAFSQDEEGGLLGELKESSDEETSTPLFGYIDGDLKVKLFEFQSDGLITKYLEGTMEDQQMSGTLHTPGKSPENLLLHWVEDPSDRGRMVNCYSSPFYENQFYCFAPYLPDIAGAYSYTLPNDKGYGAMDVSRSGDDLNTMHITITCVGAAPSLSMTEISGTGQLQGNCVTITSEQSGLSYKVIFYSQFSLVVPLSGSSDYFLFQQNESVG